jgi:hypothetical protein
MTRQIAAGDLNAAYKSYYGKPLEPGWLESTELFENTQFDMWEALDE